MPCTLRDFLVDRWYDNVDLIGRRFGLAPPEISPLLPRYTDYGPKVPVWCVTPKNGQTIHRFFDTSPFSPSGRYLATTRLPAEDRLILPGETAQIIVTDLTTGDEQCVAETRGADIQVGAHPQWGSSDHELFFNDVDPHEWRPYAVNLDLRNGKSSNLDGPIYAVSRDGRSAICPLMSRTGVVQVGYGVVVPPQFIPNSSDLADRDGIFITDLSSGNQRLLVSMRTLVEATNSPFGFRAKQSGNLVGFHMNWNPQGDRILFILRWVPILGAAATILADLRRQTGRVLRKAASLLQLELLRHIVKVPAVAYNALLAIDGDGSNPRVVVPPHVYARGGHHPSWCADGRSILMNLVVDGHWRFVKLNSEGGPMEIMSDRLIGSGHPTLHPSGHTILTDVYEWEPLAYGDGTVPIRLVDWKAGTEQTLVRMATRPKKYGERRVLRIDPHPAWDREYQRIAFNGFANGTRHVYIADLSELEL